ncbi:MAG: class I SAM-dependent methyltransferase [Chloroflexota bacterium]|nr:class I SAM-dependent methyltransferase [Chloroflexota bacterium]
MTDVGNTPKIELSGRFNDVFNVVFEDIAARDILDVASGMGGFLDIIETCLPDARTITGIDIDLSLLREVRNSRSEDRRELAQMDAAELAFPPAIFDLVSIGVSLHHLKNIPLALDEIWRILKPGGTFVISEMYRDGLTEAQLSEVHLHHWVADIDTAFGRVHNHTLTQDEIIRCAAEPVWDIVTVYDYKNPQMNMDAEQIIDRIKVQIEQHLLRAERLKDIDEIKERSEIIMDWVEEYGVKRAPLLVVKCVKR